MRICGVCKSRKFTEKTSNTDFDEAGWFATKTYTCANGHVETERVDVSGRPAQRNVLEYDGPRVFDKL